MLEYFTRALPLSGFEPESSDRVRVRNVTVYLSQ